MFTLPYCLKNLGRAEQVAQSQISWNSGQDINLDCLPICQVQYQSVRKKKERNMNGKNYLYLTFF